MALLLHGCQRRNARAPRSLQANLAQADCLEEGLVSGLYVYVSVPCTFPAPDGPVSYVISYLISFQFRKFMFEKIVAHLSCMRVGESKLEEINRMRRRVFNG